MRKKPIFVHFLLMFVNIVRVNTLKLNIIYTFAADFLDFIKR